jgi:hypothetical protein
MHELAPWLGNHRSYPAVHLTKWNLHRVDREWKAPIPMLQSRIYIQKAHRGSHDKVALVRILSQASTTRSLHISHQVSLPIDLKGTKWAPKCSPVSRDINPPWLLSRVCSRKIYTWMHMVLSGNRPQNPTIYWFIGLSMNYIELSGSSFLPFLGS